MSQSGRYAAAWMRILRGLATAAFLVPAPVVPALLVPALLVPGLCADDSLKSAGNGESALRCEEKVVANPQLGSAEVIALVNGEAISVGDVLDPFSRQLAKTKTQLAPAVHRELSRRLVAAHLSRFVDRKLAIQALKESLGEEEFQELLKQIEAAFQKQLEEGRALLGGKNDALLEAEFAKQGTNIERMRKTFFQQRLADRYFLLTCTPEAGKSLEDELQAWYRDHEQEFQIGPRVKWRQILVTHARYGSEAKAREAIETIVAALKGGKTFEDLAKEYSEGGSASEGGHWDWTQLDSIADPQVQSALETGKAGALSALIAGPKSVQVVEVIAREAGRSQPFEQVREEIETRLNRSKASRFRVASDEALNRLYSKAVIETPYELPRLKKIKERGSE